MTRVARLSRARGRSRRHHPFRTAAGNPREDSAKANSTSPVRPAGPPQLLRNKREDDGEMSNAYRKTSIPWRTLRVQMSRHCKLYAGRRCRVSSTLEGAPPAAGRSLASGGLRGSVGGRAAARAKNVPTVSRGTGPSRETPVLGDAARTTVNRPACCRRPRGRVSPAPRACVLGMLVVRGERETGFSTTPSAQGGWCAGAFAITVVALWRQGPKGLCRSLPGGRGPAVARRSVCRRGLRLCILIVNEGEYEQGWDGKYATSICAAHRHPYVAARGGAENCSWTSSRLHHAIGKHDEAMKAD